MVIGVCAIYQSKTDKINNTTTLEFAGSQTPCYIVKQINTSPLPVEFLETTLKDSAHSLHLLKADNTPIAKHFKNSKFTLKVVTLEPNDMVYLTTDGIIDQLGGPNYKKFSSKHFQDLIFKHHNLDAVQQIDYIEKEVLDWMNFPEPISGSPNDQIDDICVVGFRIE
jgi:serine phosphatase RsbU (regulator of sigma subunit)